MQSRSILVFSTCLAASMLALCTITASDAHAAPSIGVDHLRASGNNHIVEAGDVALLRRGIAKFHRYSDPDATEDEEEYQDAEESDQTNDYEHDDGYGKDWSTSSADNGGDDNNDGNNAYQW
ncbi:hypothetical protein THASP1DRAFT_22647 [Thamnocephalis sphaerospora]|uniref:RxLR effector protein n=1 Tax=Thamnocephalis sphaerospora TaxID=78915 RepID=A0A4P9XTM2_9FUNG|nr:hypothetical protein THASP1DRAFT_22647 [Thamnocephalis sphaerospora]|eukprot:RKP09528.1 hypothetical protein THASP1DRAFT_22647 [Thamnocephalis sphaerospora]